MPSSRMHSNNTVNLRRSCTAVRAPAATVVSSRRCRPYLLRGCTSKGTCEDENVTCLSGKLAM